MKTKDKLLDQYYLGETTLEEERLLKEQVLFEQHNSLEKDVFKWYLLEGAVPEDLEERMFDKIKRKEKYRTLQQAIIRFSAIAASVAVLLASYLSFDAERNRRIESQFFVMEQALYQMSESLQPYPEEEMFVLWVDDNVEIIIE